MAFLSHLASSGARLFDTSSAISSRCSIVVESLSRVVFEIYVRVKTYRFTLAAIKMLSNIQNSKKKHIAS